MTHVITRMKTVGNLIIYKREWTEPGLAKFVVYDDRRDEMLAQFSRLDAAKRWALAKVRHA